MLRYAKALVGLGLLAVYAVAQAAGFDLGEVGTSIDADLLVQGLVGAFLVWLTPNR